MKQENQSLSIPTGFRFAGCASGIKQSGKPDLSILVSDESCLTLGAFTQNVVRASCVDWNASRIGKGRALVINSGNANACTGIQGAQDTATMATQLADQTKAVADEVYVMSTGIIGETLPMEKVTNGIDAAVKRLDRSEASVREFADGILTTDSFPKIKSVSFSTDQGAYSILGIAKGAGMIGPRMATMLCVLVTDFPLGKFLSEVQQPTEKQSELHRRFLSIIDKSFNSISVDGHTSTSDQVLLFASGDLTQPVRETELIQFFENLESVSRELAKMIPADGEGAQHLMSIEVHGSYAETELRSVAKTIADSPLVKTAVFGADPNWGRIVSAAGYDGLKFDPNETSLWVNGFLLYENGTPVAFDETEVSSSMKENFETRITLEISKNSDDPSWNSAQFWASDLTYDYVKINAEYHT